MHKHSSAPSEANVAFNEYESVIGLSYWQMEEDPFAGTELGRYSYNCQTFRVKWSCKIILESVLLDAFHFS